jgi:thioredoxin-like negative regulator of GroEL
MIFSKNIGKSKSRIWSLFILKRDQRLQQLKQTTSGPFGSVIELSRPDFVQEVTEASKSHFVFLHLYQDGQEACQLIKRAYQSLAPKYGKFKFIQIISTRCIENYPDAHLPTILVYKDGSVFSQLLKATPEQLELFIGKINKILEEEEDD